MRNPIFTGLVALTTIGSLSACDSFVQDVDPPIDRVISDSLNTPGQVPFLATGVREGFNDTYDVLAVLSDLLSDAAVFNTAVLNSTFPTFDEIDDGLLGYETQQFDNNSIDGLYSALNEYRYLADDLLRRADEDIEFPNTPEGQDAEQIARFTGNFHGAIARYFLGTYFSVDGVTGGAPITTDPDSPQPALTTAELYSQAQDKLATALTFLDPLDSGDYGDYSIRVVNTLRARIALFEGNLAQACTYAEDGLVITDDPFSGEYASTSVNNWWSDGGRGRTQVSIAPRFAVYDEVDNRALVERAPPASASDTTPYYRQALYQLNSDPLPFLTWQENTLILAECALLQDQNAAETLTLINVVRDARGIAPLDSASLDDLIVARDRELFTQGLRLIDQRRFDIFHLPNSSTFFPVNQTERNANPNF